MNHVGHVMMLLEQGNNIEKQTKHQNGTMTTITAMPSLIEAIEDLQSIPLSKRKCLFASEKDLKLFKNYSQDGCMFECLLDLAYKATNCTPWNYPHLHNNQNTCVNFYWSHFWSLDLKIS